MKKILALLALFLIVAVAGCTGNNSASQNINEDNTTEGQGRLAIAMKDKPISNVGEVSRVDVTISSIQVHMSGNASANITGNETTNDTEVTNSGWTTVVSGRQTINLLDYTGNAAALFGETQLQAGKYQQIRLYVENATMTYANGSTNTTQTLTIPSNVIKIVRGFNVKANETTLITVDWDLDNAIKVSGKDSYRLQPVFKIEEENNVNLATKANLKVLGAGVNTKINASLNTSLGLGV